jgi:hypothetical protein
MPVSLCRQKPRRSDEGLDPRLLFGYADSMTQLKKTLNIPVPADRRVLFEIPADWNTRVIHIEISPITEEKPSLFPLRAAEGGAIFPQSEYAEDRWEDRLREGDDPFAWHELIGAFPELPSVDEFLARRYEENLRDEANAAALREQYKPAKEAAQC